MEKKHKFGLIILSFIFAFLLLNFTPDARAQVAEKASNNEARTIWLRGFEVYERAEINEKAGKYDEALKGFEEAAALFKNVQSKYPQWNNSLIEYRVKICSRKIEGLKPLCKKSAEPVKKAPPQEAKDIDTYILREKILRKELEEAKKKIEIAFAAIVEARKEAAKGVLATEGAARLANENHELEKKYAIISDELKKALEKSSRQQDNSESEIFNKKILEMTDSKSKIEEEIKTIRKNNEELKKENQNLKFAGTEYRYRSDKYEKTIKDSEARA